MKNISLSILYSLLLLFLFNAAAIASDITISGSARFRCNFLSKYMEKHGYSFIKEITYDNNFKTNIFVARDATVIIKNKDNTILGVGKTDKKGNFSISVPKDRAYRILVQFHGREVEHELSYSDSENFIADLGYFDIDTVGSWIPMPPMSYCYTCDIRYLETTESR